MNIKTAKILTALLPFLLSGCASMDQTPSRLACTVAGALIAGGATAASDVEEEVALASAAVGAALGYVICDEEKEARPAPRPVSEPAPRPAPVSRPDPDSDGDGVVDRRDNCPDTARGTPVDERGCPVIPDLAGVHFEYNKADITPRGQGILDEAVRILQQNTHVGINIVGHTDDRGSEQYNQGLSERRANAVRDYLRARGISGSRMTTSGQGESNPVASNDTADGRARNRRVDITAHQM